MPRALSDTRIRILRRLADRKLDRDGAETAEEIRVALGRRTSGWANGPLREMAFHGLAQRLGTSMRDAATWTITDAGRAALAEASDPTLTHTEHGEA